jgi:hypothetical protein
VTNVPKLRSAGVAGPEDQPKKNVFATSPQIPSLLWNREDWPEKQDSNS